MTTLVLIGNPTNLFVFDYEQKGMGSAPFSGNVDRVQETWELVRDNVRVSNSTGSLYRRPAAGASLPN